MPRISTRAFAQIQRSSIRDSISTLTNRTATLTLTSRPPTLTTVTTSSSSNSIPLTSRFSFSAPRTSSSILSLLSTSTSTSTSASIPSSSTSTSAFSSSLGSLRFRSYGAEYQPSQRIRKRRHGFLNRLKSQGGRKILRRRSERGRRFLTH